MFTDMKQSYVDILISRLLKEKKIRNLSVHSIIVVAVSGFFSKLQNEYSFYVSGLHCFI